MPRIGPVDRFQRRFRPVGVPIAVVYKFVDDQGNYLAAIITYYAFIAIFPLLLLASSILGFVLQGNQGLQQAVLSSALSQFPVIGDELTAPEGLQGSVGAVVVGSLTALYGALGLGQAVQNAMNVAWSVPRNSRPNPFLLRLRSLLLLIVAGLSVLAVTAVSVVGANTQVFSDQVDATLRLLISLVTVLLLGLVFTLLYRLAAARDHSFWAAAPGAFATALMWQALQYLGALYVSGVVSGASALNATFALVLGLLGVIYLAAVMALLGMEINVVLVRKLYPRALLTPFTDAVVLTKADRRAYTLYARRERHKGFERVDVVFDEQPSEPGA